MRLDCTDPPTFRDHHRQLSIFFFSFGSGFFVDNMENDQISIGQFVLLKQWIEQVCCRCRHRSEKDSTPMKFSSNKSFNSNRRESFGEIDEVEKEGILQNCPMLKEDSEVAVFECAGSAAGCCHFGNSRRPHHRHPHRVLLSNLLSNQEEQEFCCDADVFWSRLRASQQRN